MTYETVIHKYSGAEIRMPISEDGYSLCPVCGEKARNKEFRPYDEEGMPSYGICSCGIEFGYECSPESTEQDWVSYREKWIQSELEFGNSRKLSKSEKLTQLKQIGIENYC